MVNGLVVCWRVVELGANVLVVGVHCGLGHGFSKVAVSSVVVVLVNGLLGQELLVFWRGPVLWCRDGLGCIP